MKKYTKKVLFFIFFIAFLFISVFFGFSLKTNPYKYLTNLNNINDFNVDTSKRYVIPGGQAIGVELKTEGVLVVGLADIENLDKISTSPAKLSGIQIGDKILGIDSIEVESTDDIVEYTKLSGVKEYSIKVERNGKISNCIITPVQIYKSDEIKFGFWARDDIAGIGTVTFIDPETFRFGAIGHGIADTDTGKLIDIEYGSISKANITNIKLGKKGEPGEIMGYILKDEDSLGTVEKNTNFGIYGKINQSGMSYLKNDLIEVGAMDEIRLGPAVIYSCVNNKIKKYNIEIIKMFYQNKPSEKSFVLKITDPELLGLTNGIIQGMSGCPVIQNNKIVGAVTHVFMNDPSKGYGIYIDWIYDEIYNNKSEL